MIEEIRNLGLNFEEGDYNVEELSSAKSIWLTSSTKGLAQVTEIVNLNTDLITNHKYFWNVKEVLTINILVRS